MRIGRGAKGSVPRPRCRARRARRWRARRRRRRRAAAPTSHPRGDGVTRTFKILTLFSRLTTSFGHHTERRTEPEHRRDVRRGSLHFPRHPRRASVGVRRASSPDPSADHARRGRVLIVLGAVVQKSSSSHLPRGLARPRPRRGPERVDAQAHRRRDRRARRRAGVRGGRRPRRHRPHPGQLPTPIPRVAAR